MGPTSLDGSEEDGYVLAETLGLDAFHCMSGDDGRVYFLEDGRVLKTCAEHEAALHWRLFQAQESGFSHPCVPRIHLVVRYDATIDLSEHGLGPHETVRFAFLRDELADLEGPDGRFAPGTRDRRLLDAAIEHLSWGWRFGNPDHVDHALGLWDGPEIEDVLAGLRAVLSATGCRVVDVRWSNLGTTGDGRVGMRDLGRFDGPTLTVEEMAGIPTLRDMVASRIPHGPA